MSEQDTHPRQQRIGPTKRVLTILAIIVGLLAGYGFFVRFFHFFKTLQSNEDGRFTIVPMLNYLAVACGFLCMLGWSVCRGMFRDIEKPKYTMLENEERLDRELSSERSS